MVSCWQFPFAIFAWALWFGPILSDCIAGVTCGPCPPGFGQDVAINAATQNVCIPSSEPDATRLEFQVEREPGGLEDPVVASAECTTSLSLSRQNRLRTHARFCDATRCSEWGEWSDWISRLPQFPLCLGDFDGDGDVDGADFMLFRGAYMDGCNGD